MIVFAKPLSTTMLGTLLASAIAVAPASTALARQTQAPAAQTPATPQPEQQFEFVEEIERIPEGHRGTWTVGGRTFLVNDETQFALDHPAVLGALAEVGFVVRGDIAVALQIEPQPFRATDINDGPYIFWRNQGTAEVVSLCRGERTLRSFEEVDGELVIEPLCDGTMSTRVARAAPTSPPAEWPMPENLLAISDIEGNARALAQFLENAGVTDADGHWNWDAGHLVFVGDIVDRGAEVTETLWMIRRLEREAADAGGAVHYILGNHEAMIMAGDIRYTHLKYKFVAARLGIAYPELFGRDSDMGRWLRSRNTIERIGNLLFVHGGYSPLLDQLAPTMDELNHAVRAQLDNPKPASRATDPLEQLAWHAHGPLWYRGYFDEFAERLGGVPTREQLAAILERHGAEHIVVGHTTVEDITALGEDGRVIAIDVVWRESGEAEGLLQAGGALWRVLADGTHVPLSAR